MIELLLTKLPSNRVRGHYDVNRDGISNDYLPARFLFLHPLAAASYLRMERTVVFTDIFRSAESSLEARTRKRGVQAPAYSGHNYGLAWDVAVDETLKVNAWQYGDLLNYMVQHQWYCYRRDGKRGTEDWHFNFLGPDPAGILRELDPRPWLGRRTWSRAAELAIQRHYGGQFALPPVDVQRCLQRLRLYQGELDGKLGPVSQSAITVFGRAWQVPPVAGDSTFQRTLAYVAAQVQYVDAAT